MTLDTWAKLSIVWLLLGVAALVAMAESLGRNKPASSPLRKRFHRVFGYGFTVLYVVFLLGMFARLERFGPPHGLWIGLHAYLGCTLLALLAVKIAIVRRYKKYKGGLARLGTLIMTVTLVLVVMSGGWRIGSRYLKAGTTVCYRGDTYRGSAGLGKRVIYQKCVRCHDLRPVFLFARSQPEWERYLVRMQAKDPALLTNEDCANCMAYLIELGVSQNE